MTMNCAIMPRCPCKSVEVSEQLGFSPPGLLTQLVEIPTMSRAVRIIGALTPGDTLTYIEPDGVTPVGNYAMSDPLLGIPLPIAEQAAYIKYTSTTATPKIMFMEFETWF
jgi:hypothetical protein